MTVKMVDYCCIIHDISKSEGIHLLDNSILNDCGYIYKIHIQECNFKSRVYNNYFDISAKVKKL